MQVFIVHKKHMIPLNHWTVLNTEGWTIPKYSVNIWLSHKIHQVQGSLNQLFFSGIQTWVFLFFFFIRQTVLLAGWGENGGSCWREICTEKKRSHQRFFLSNQCLLHKDIRKGLINMVHSLTGSPPDLQLPSASGSGLLTSTF